MKRKRCFKCHRMRALTSFYPHPMMRDGHLNKCKDCTKRDVQKSYRDNWHKRRAYEKKRNRDPARRARSRVYASRRVEDPRKKKTRNAVNNAIRQGKLTRPTACSACGGPKPQAHHADYDKPFEIEWLCFRCHNAAHGKLVD